MKTVPKEDLELIILETSAHGQGSLEYIRTTLRNAKEPVNPPSASEQPPFCKCGNCREMPTQIENKCCSNSRCLRERQIFKKISLDVDFLRQSIRERADYRAETFDFSNRSLRKAAYRQYVLWRYGKLGRGNRRVVPSCIVLCIREQYPSPNGLYMGYRES